MTIQILEQDESFGLIARSHLARLACASGGQPYVVPINYVLDDSFLYSFSTFGRKIEWMRANPSVCVEIDDIAHNRNWESVVATGRYEELTETAEKERHRRRAWELLQTRANWWQPGFVRTVISGVERPMVPIFFRIHLDEVTGHRLDLTSPQPSQEKSNLTKFIRTFLGYDGRHGPMARRERPFKPEIAPMKQGNRP